MVTSMGISGIFILIFMCSMVMMVHHQKKDENEKSGNFSRKLPIRDDLQVSGEPFLRKVSEFFNRLEDGLEGEGSPAIKNETADQLVNIVLEENDFYGNVSEASDINFSLKESLTDDGSFKIPTLTSKNFQLKVHHNQLLRKYGTQDLVWVSLLMKGNCINIATSSYPFIAFKNITNDLANYLQIDEEYIFFNELSCSGGLVKLNFSITKVVYLSHEDIWSQQLHHKDTSLYLISRSYVVVNYTTKKSQIFIQKKFTFNKLSLLRHVALYGLPAVAITLIVFAALMYSCHAHWSETKDDVGGEAQHDDIGYRGDFQETEPFQKHIDTEGRRFYGEPTISISEKRKGSDANKSEGTEIYPIQNLLSTFQQPHMTKTPEKTVSSALPKHQGVSDISDFSESENSDDYDQVENEITSENLWYFGDPVYRVTSVLDLPNEGEKNSKTTKLSSSENLSATRIRFVDNGSPSFRIETDL